MSKAWCLLWKNGRWPTTFQYTISEALDTIYYEDRLSADELRNKESDNYACRYEE